MGSGAHYTEFVMISGEPYIGIVRPMPSLHAEVFVGDCYFFGPIFLQYFSRAKIRRLG